MDVSRVSSRLCWHMGYSITANHITAEEVTTSECQDYLWPSRDIVSSVSQFEWEVPYNSHVGLRRFVGMLRNSLFVTLHSYCGNLQNAVASRYLLENQICSTHRLCCSLYLTECVLKPSSRKASRADSSHP